jgi:hypothetical protein
MTPVESPQDAIDGASASCAPLLEPIKTQTDTVEVRRDIPTPVSLDESTSDRERHPRQRSRSAVVSPIQKQLINRRDTPSPTHGLFDPLPESLYRSNTSSSFLKPGSRFTGLQSSPENLQYDVTVDIQNVDMDNSFLCGYLKIQGLAPEHPTLTTYFEGEIIGSKYGFITQHPEWGAREKLDMESWGRFPPFRTHAREARKPGYAIRNWENKDYLWMRWKEYFLVPDHTVTDLAGASFEGFYYICFHQATGEIKGVYYHAKNPR